MNVRPPEPAPKNPETTPDINANKKIKKWNQQKIQKFQTYV